MTITAKVIADSIGSSAPRLTTLQLRYPKFIHAEFMTHRVFSRNASSSRAIPVERLIKDVIADPVFPSFWGKNQKGMQAHEECSNLVILEDIPYSGGEPDGSTVIELMPAHVPRKVAWIHARTEAIKVAQAFTKAGYHKQIVNRLLEPFCHINVVVTATEWSNFFELRCHPDAQPEMRLLAEAIREAMKNSTPKKLGVGQWHLPYADGIVEKDHPEPTIVTDPEMVIDRAIKVSVARCARVSYLTQEGKEPTVQEDLALYDRLVGSRPLHASPAEHQATPDWNSPHLHGNFRGWKQYRKMLERYGEWSTKKEGTNRR